MDKGMKRCKEAQYFAGFLSNFKTYRALTTPKAGKSQG
jgi:hypothetical protein